MKASLRSRTSSVEKPPGRRAKLIVYVVTFLMVLVPFLFWKETWFGRKLNDQEMANYLDSSAKARNIQHALLQISERLSEGKKADVKKWYPKVLALVNHPVPEVRLTVAWCLGQDNQEEPFRESLLALLRDHNILVRRNAALALVRFGDHHGRDELLNTLKPEVLTSPWSGKITFRLNEDDSVGIGTLLARIHPEDGQTYEFRSPLPGFLERKLVTDGQEIQVGQAILVLSPSEDQVWEALRGLYLIGQPEDIPNIEPFTRKSPHLADRTRQQARLTIEAIRNRNPAGQILPNS